MACVRSGGVSRGPFRERVPVVSRRVSVSTDAALEDSVMMIDQPLLFVPPEIELGLLEGTFKLFGSVVREADTGRIYKHLTELVPSPEKAEEAVKSMKLNPKVVISVVAA